jgi:hypothetical protein
LKQAAVEIAVLSILAAIPTAAGYVLGPATRAVSQLSSLAGLPFAPRLGFLPLVTSVVLARLYLGRGAALKEGVLLAVTGAVFHPRDLQLRLPRNVMLGLGVELALLKAGNPGSAECLLASLAGGLLSYAPYLLFAPLGVPSAALYAALVLSTVNHLITCAAGGYLAVLVARKLPRLPGFAQR